MKALILAAGRGTRIHSVHGDHPKCLIRFNGTKSTILDHQIESLFSAGIANIGIVVGYEKDQIIQHVIKNYPRDQKRFCFIENPAFATTNNIYSFWLAQTWLNGEPFICLNGGCRFRTANSDPRDRVSRAHHYGCGPRVARRDDESAHFGRQSHSHE